MLLFVDYVSVYAIPCKKVNIYPEIRLLLGRRVQQLEMLSSQQVARRPRLLHGGMSPARRTSSIILISYIHHAIISL